MPLNSTKPPQKIGVDEKSQWQIPLEGSSLAFPYLPTGPVPRSMRRYWARDPKARALQALEAPWLRIPMVRASIQC